MNKYLLYLIQFIGIVLIYFGVIFILKGSFLPGFVLFVVGLIINNSTILRLYGGKDGRKQT